MEGDILAELKQINTQLSQVIYLLKTRQVGHIDRDVQRSPNPDSIASEVQRKIAEARRKVEENMSSSKNMMPDLGGLIK